MARTHLDSPSREELEQFASEHMNIRQYMSFARGSNLSEEELVDIYNWGVIRG